MLSLCYTWFERGSGKQFRIPTRWSSQGRINLIGTYRLYGETEVLEYRELEGNCRKALVIDYLEQLFMECKPELLTVIVLDNATFHKSQKTIDLIKGKKCEVIFLPAYSPDLNPIENMWAHLKSFVKKVKKMFSNFEETLDYALYES